MEVRGEGEEGLEGAGASFPVCLSVCLWCIEWTQR